MKLFDIKLTAKLGISVSSFLLPLGILLFYVIILSGASINKDKEELNGLKVLRPAINLMQSIPQFIHYSLEDTASDVSSLKQNITNLIDEFDNLFNHFYPDKTYDVKINNILRLWNLLNNSTELKEHLQSYEELIHELIYTISYIGDISGLITDSDIENSYLVFASIHELPQAQERIIIIENLFRIFSHEDSSPEQINELKMHINLLNYSENTRIQNRYNFIELLGLDSHNAGETINLMLRNCYNRISYFSETSNYIIDNPNIGINAFPVIFEISSQASSAAYRLQITSFDRIEENLVSRINANRIRLYLYLAAILAAAILAFTIMIKTLKYINESAKEISLVFRQLDANDLTASLCAKYNDEMGDLMKSLNGFLKNLNAAFLSFNNNASLVTSSLLDLSSSAMEITAAANEQSASVAEIVATMESNKELSSQSAEKTMEVALLSRETKELAGRGADIREINENMMLEILNQNSKIIEIINNLKDILSRVDESTHVIDSIADKTKLIAFNAALEASSADEESGSRFSQVAQDIRRFADNVAESVKEIKENLKELQDAAEFLIHEEKKGSDSINSGYKRIVEQKEVFENIKNITENAAIRTQEISNLSRQQEAASSHVFIALKEISSGINQFVSAVKVTKEAVDKLNSMSVELEETISRYKITGASDDRF